MSESVIHSYHRHRRELSQASQAPSAFPFLACKAGPTTHAQSPLDLKACKYFDDFAESPSNANARFDQARQEAENTHGAEYVRDALRSQRHHELKRHRAHDFRLDASETDKLRQLGFVVSARLRNSSFARAYYDLYTDDMPVFITVDSVLHAWHRTFDHLLMELEVSDFVPRLEKVLQLTLDQCHSRHFRTSASLEEANQAAPSLLARACRVISCRGSEEASGHVVKITEDLDLFLSVGLCLLKGTSEFGLQCNKNKREDMLDAIKGEQPLELALFGASPRTIDCSDSNLEATTPIAGGQHEHELSYQLQCAVLLVDLTRNAKTLADLVKIDTEISSLIADANVGADAMTPQQLHELLSWDATNIASFALLGQRFVWNAFIFSEVVFDRVVHDGVAVLRRIPSHLDIAFALFGNSAASELLTQRMEATSATDGFIKFQDGEPFAGNLVALRSTVDEYFESNTDSANDSISSLWLRALRELSADSANEDAVFHTSAWKRRMMNTQLASFTQLRHASVLYAKQSFTAMTACEYPAGYVDPYPKFWAAMKMMAKVCESRYPKAKRFFDNFAATMETLEEITLAQQQQNELSEKQVRFLKDIVEIHSGSGPVRYNGWYPKLFLKAPLDSDERDVIAVDVHTDSPSIEHGDPGGILHWGVGDVFLGVFVVNNAVYAGPVLSHYEFVMPKNQRLTDKEFEQRLPVTPSPVWATDSFLCVPSKAVPSMVHLNLG
ncbi:TPA: hypothetical protein N0F65_006926 [Lagenidium giganteum]|uniref:Uncharacterized protein n=1 Tax=Lagenidium giganteum TaxID=4803 RepID=A0AAV2ZK64_9STRA|nr:TPA: hypothetical protein N0F65_006926 [Lagenidium giganteum]